MDVRQLTEQLTAEHELPGVALLVARDVVESSVIKGEVDEEAGDSLRLAVEHLESLHRGSDLLLDHPTLIDELSAIAMTRRFPQKDRLKVVRESLRVLVSTVPAAGDDSF